MNLIDGRIDHAFGASHLPGEPCPICEHDAHKRKSELFYNDELSRRIWLENADGTPRRDCADIVLEGLIAPGEVDERSIEDVTYNDIRQEPREHG